MIFWCEADWLTRDVWRQHTTWPRRCALIGWAVMTVDVVRMRDVMKVTWSKRPSWLFMSRAVCRGDVRVELSAIISSHYWETERERERSQDGTSAGGVVQTRHVGTPAPFPPTFHPPLPLLSLSPPSSFPLFFPSPLLRSRPPYCGCGVWRSALAPP